MIAIGLALFLLLLPLQYMDSVAVEIRYGIRKRDRPERYRNVEGRKRLGRNVRRKGKNRGLEVSSKNSHLKALVALDTEHSHAKRCRTKSGCRKSMPKVAARRGRDQAVKLVQDRAAKRVQD